MVRHGLAGAVLCGLLLAPLAAKAQGTPPLPSMPRPPSFSDPVAPEKARKPARRSQAAKGGAGAGAAAGGSPSSFERPNRYVPAEFDRERGGGAGSGARPMMTPSGRAGMGMQF